MPPAAPMNMPGKIGPAAEGAQRQAVGERLAGDEQRRALRPSTPAALWMSGASASWPENSTWDEPLSVPSAKTIASPPTASPTSGVRRIRRGSTIGCRASADRRMRGPEHRCGDADGDRPQELREVRCREHRKVRDGERERAEPGPRVQSHEDRGRPCPRPAGPGSAPRRAAGRRRPPTSISRNAPDQRRPEQRADGREAAGDADHHAGRAGDVPPGQPHDEDAEPAADRDQRRLRAEHRAEAEGRKRRAEDAGQLDRRGSRRC